MAKTERKRGWFGGSRKRYPAGLSGPQAASPDLTDLARDSFRRNLAIDLLDLAIDLLDLAINSFQRNLEILREVVPVRTACMHGSPLSRFDNRKIWEKYEYRDYGIIAEPYFDVDYSKVWYITDTGRSWGRNDANIRDRVDSGFGLRIRRTDQLIRLARSGELPRWIIINTHPQRWNDPGYRWVRELILQNVKNLLKSILVRLRRRGRSVS